MGLQWMSGEREGGPPVDECGEGGRPPVDEWGGGGGLYFYKGSVWGSHMVILHDQFRPWTVWYFITLHLLYLNVDADQLHCVLNIKQFTSHYTTHKKSVHIQRSYIYNQKL